MSSQPSQDDLDNHANQLNPNHDEYRGEEDRPDTWQDRLPDSSHDEG